ncbi:serine hydrolase domain-containing protein [Pontibacter sp. G13]|uniref:serine hydrolase domain-containing protein n=1 Tax=Pontibacter sp. G13 TaxID=3074898 RepID=UPI00288C18AA|nr:serine hydrolase domain-containing protein [Pontibacter sp. G13]WNJ18399.1 serine hydrolase domain-containing protein [Pontibacter sp. G13]
MNLLNLARYCLLLGLGSMTAHSLFAQSSDWETRIQDVFAPFDRSDHPGFAVGIMKDTSVIFQGGFGTANLEYQIPITPQTAFDLASVSKRFTAAGIALLMVEGRISLDSYVGAYFPDLGHFRDTLRLKHLIYNTSGIPEYWNLSHQDSMPWFDMYHFDYWDAWQAIIDMDQLEFRPGMKWAYRNSNYILLADVIQQESDQSFPAFMRQRIFLPLGMNHSLINADVTEIIPNRATPYMARTPERISDFQEVGMTLDTVGAWIQMHRTSSHFGGSGMYSTVEDLMKWCRNFAEPAWGGAAWVEWMHHTESFPHGRNNQAFGLYWGEFARRKYVAWDGGTYGVSTEMIRFPEQQVAIVVLSNWGEGRAHDKAMEIAQILIDAGIL